MDMIEQRESDEALQIWLDDFLTNLPPKPRGKWWSDFTLGKKFEWAGKRFCQFQCPAGSLFAHIIVAAQKKKHDRTAISVGVWAKDNSPVATAFSNGEEKDFDPKEIKEVPTTV